jgi:phosphoribosylanthranilate isomerase
MSKSDNIMNAKPRHTDMMIKVCGNCHRENIESVAVLSPLLMGFIFYRPSVRNACELDPAVVRALPEYIRPVAVFVDASESEIESVCASYGFKIVQLHGAESPAMCGRLRAKGLIVIKSIGIGDDMQWTQLSPYAGNVDMFLFDTLTDGHGGSGKKFSWRQLNYYNLNVPYMLSGGIGPEDVDNIIDAMRPGMVGIDINSRFEDAPGIKNITQLTRFIVSLRKFNEDESIAIPFWEKR